MTDNIERRFSGACEVRADSESNNLMGHAAVYYRKGDDATQFSLGAGAVERIMPGAFDAAIEREDDVRALFNHDSNHVLGRTASGTLRLEADETGLRYEVDLPDTTTARDVRQSIARGDISGSSFAFIADDVTWSREDGMDVREIRSVRLYDVGPVTYPAYESTTTATRAMDELAEVRSARDEVQATGSCTECERLARRVQSLEHELRQAAARDIRNQIR